MFRSILWCLMGFGVQYSQYSDTIMRVESCRDGEGIFFLLIVQIYIMVFNGVRLGFFRCPTRML